MGNRQHQTEIVDINGGYCFRFFEASEELIQPLARMITAESDYSKLHLSLIKIIVFAGFYSYCIYHDYWNTCQTNTIMGDYILPIIAYLKKDGTIIDIFVLSCLISIFVVLGSQLFLKGSLETFDIKLYTIAVSYGMGFKLDCISEICFLLSYLSLRNIYIF